MKYKVGDKFGAKCIDSYKYEILTVDKGFYHTINSGGIVNHITDSVLDENYTIIEPEKPVAPPKGTVCKVWDDDVDDYCFDGSLGEVIDGWLLCRKGNWQNWKVVKQP